MKVQLNTDKNIDGTQGLARSVEARLNSALERFEGQITRVEVHLSDNNGAKAGRDDKRCMIEARLAGLDPLVASHEAPTVDLAIDGGVHKITKIVETAMAKRER